jgi:LPS-assembly lipoprotein
MKALLLVFGVALAIGGCGFAPLYAPAASGLAAGDAATELAAVDVALMPERSGQVIRQDVQQRLERFGAGAAKRYKLSIGLSITQDAAGVQPDSSVTFIRVRASADWRLTLLDPKSTLVTAGNARAIDGFNVIDQEVFAQTLETERVQDQLSQRIADEIALQLATYFKLHGPAVPPA